MDRTERFYKIDLLIRHRGCVSLAALMDELGVSRATLKRDLEYLRDRMGSPIVYDRDANGYRFAAADARNERHELPGLWFSERELYSLLMAHQLLSGLDEPGTLVRHLQPLLERIHQMLGPGEDDVRAVMQRVRIVMAARRAVPPGVFELLGEALLERRRVRLRYYSRGRGELGDREVSPQRLVHYRATWYLDAWCHRSDGLRRFALDAVQQAELAESRAREVPMKQVQAAMDAGYGIFAGGRPQWATLIFGAQAAAWIRSEQWHPDQQGRDLPDGRFELRLPYVDPTELVMDVLRHGEHVQVAAPPALAEAVAARLRSAAALYG